MFIDSISKATLNFTTASVIDTTNNITLMGVNSPYMSNITFSVNGTQQLWYQPNSMIIGTNLPNRTSSSNNGTINWGTNPTGLLITMGGIVGYESTSPTSNVTSPPAIGAYKASSGWFATGAYTGVLTPEIIEVFNNAATNLGMSDARSLWLMIMFGVAAAVGLSVLLFTGSVLIMIFVILAVLTFGASSGVIDMALVWITGILSFATFYLVKQH